MLTITLLGTAATMPLPDRALTAALVDIFVILFHYFLNILLVLLLFLILLDQGAGGTGETFDWSLVPAIKRPWFLAGGLGCENLESAIHLLLPWAVDVSSSVETGGHKDPDKILEAVYPVRSIKEEI